MIPTPAKWPGKGNDGGPLYNLVNRADFDRCVTAAITGFRHNNVHLQRVNELMRDKIDLLHALAELNMGASRAYAVMEPGFEKERLGRKVKAAEQTIMTMVRGNAR